MSSWLSKLGKRFGSSATFRLALGAFVAVALAIVGYSLRGDAREQPVSYTELTQIVASGETATARFDGERVMLERRGGEVAVGIVGDAAARSELVSKLAASGAKVDFGARERAGVPEVIGAVAPLLVIVAVGLVFFGMHRKRQRGHFASFSESGAPVHFTDVAGMDEVKAELKETVEFLRAPEGFARLGGRAPRGVLLTGDPGTGKTLLARAVATEAGVPFLSASGSSFQEMFVGVGASRVRTLFIEARKVAPCIIFIDEIDAVGRARGRNADSAAADHDQTLNQLLVEMDGFDHTTGIVVMASTNRSDVLDPALLRPGRFDRQVMVPLPDIRGREEILNVHARPLTLTEDIDLGYIARGTPGFSGADLANLLNEAAILAAREGADAVELSHVDRARDRVMMGIERKGVLVDEGERRATAVHEAGHVAVGMVASSCDPVHKVSILPRGRALGVTQALPEKDRLMYTKEYLEDQICMLMGGRAAELVVLGTMTAGASDDIQRAAGLARKMVAELGMSELGPISLADGPGHSPRSAHLIDRVDEVTRALVEEQLRRAVRIVEERRAEIEALVGALLVEETLDAAAILACFPKDGRRPAA